VCKHGQAVATSQVVELKKQIARAGQGWGVMQDVMAQWVINLPDCGVPATAKSGNLLYPLRERWEAGAGDFIPTWRHV